MKKIWLVFKYEYLRRVKTRGFIFAVLSMPLLVILAILMALISVKMQTNSLPAGYVDLAGIVSTALPEDNPAEFEIGAIDLLAFDMDSGRDALSDNNIQALFVIQDDYLENGQINVYANERPGENAFDRIENFLQANLIAQESNTVKDRIQKGSNFTVQSLDGSRQANMRDWFVVLFPFMTGLLFIIIINISGGYLLQSVVDEKESRTMEIIVTSISPEQLMYGKILGNLSVGLTQLLIWVSFAALGTFGMQMIYHYGQMPQFTPTQAYIIGGIILPGFILIAALMTLVGVTATEMREAQQVSLLFTLPMVTPYWFAGAVLQHPDNVLTTFLSIFPFTAIVTMPLRLSIAAVPVWQIILTAALMWGSAIGALILAAKAFRLGMLQYGKRLHLKEIIKYRNHE